ncbi:MAG TPA: hypothetical protein VFH27_03080 [Longimicrobiaceae bacterium]|nr:hypothetical protein [Longimicrobiaceae bacterium]
MMDIEIRTARPDPRLSARVVRSTPLLYATGADASVDRPAHVRSASGLVRVAGRLVAVQDDANFLALIDERTGLATPLVLPAGADGRRQFDDGRGNKHLKLDLEACTVVPDDGGGEMLVAFGSGSLGPRESVVLVGGWEDGEPRAQVVAAPELYAALRGIPHFAGSELNLEGAAFMSGGVIRLVNRGNGAPSAGLQPVDAICDVRWQELRAYLAGSGPAPAIANVVQYRLGALDGCRLTFTDAAAVGDAMLFSAAAEDSPDAVQDGPVAGSSIGIAHAGGEVRMAVIQAADGGTLLEKVEGICPGAADPRRLLAVVDRDAPGSPSLLLEIALDGPWF